MRKHERGPKSEYAIQNKLAHWAQMHRKHELAVPNTLLFRWESDLISVTKSCFVHDFEIKVDRGDLLSELKYAGQPPLALNKWGYISGDAKAIKHSHLQHGPDLCKYSTVQRPNYFWFVTLHGVASAKDIPAYAGWIVVSTEGRLLEHKNAPRLHREKIQTHQMWALARGLGYRYWGNRPPLQD